MVLPLPASSQEREALRAGPLSFIFESGGIRGVANGRGEVVRRVYLAVRDEFWNTIPGEISNLSIEKTSSSCSVTFDSRHRRGEIDFLWHGNITGSQDGELAFSMEGRALSSFKRRRIGFCVLHSAALCKGKPCVVETSDGGSIHSAFPLLIAPRQPFTNIRSMTYGTADGRTATIRFDGDLFETEDQRNWTDFTFKTYAPPIDAAGKEIIEKGTTIGQKVTISVSESLPCHALSPAPPLRLDFRVSRPSGVFPRLGFTADTSEGRESFTGRPSGNRIEGLLRSLDFSHARIDIRLSGKDIDGAARRAVSIGKKHVVPIECALHFGGDAESGARVIAEAFTSPEIPVSRFLIYHANGPAFLEPILPSCVKIVRDAFPDTKLFAGTNGYFVEINRSRPPLGLVDGICYCATPQVHTFDAIAIMENLPGLLETLTTARAIALGKKISISPLTLRPRKNPLVPRKDGGPDERRGALFAAAWMLGSIAYCIEGGLNSLTLGALSGPEGIFSDGEEIFPSFILASWLSPFIGSPAACRFSTNPSRVIGVELERGGRFSAIAVNCTGETISADFGGLPAGCRCSILNEEGFKRVRGLDDPAGAAPEFGIPDEKNSITLDLPAYAIIRFSSGNVGASSKPAR